MYYSLIVVMVSTPANLSLPSRVILSRQVGNRSIEQLQGSFTSRLIMAIICLTFVTIVVPENPEHLASMCERHNPVNACQVW